jgi:hypothetical protein
MWLAGYCICPPGTKLLSVPLLTDCAGAGSHVPSTAGFCEPPTVGPTWGGLYEVDAAGACIVPNTYTQGCSCPQGAATMTAISSPPMSVVTDNLVLCAMPGQPGGYMLEDPSGAPVDGGSVDCHPNPTTSTCTCPIGSGGVQLRIENGGTSLHGATLAVCQ